MGWKPKAAQPLGRDTIGLNYVKDSGREGELVSVDLVPPTSTQASSQVLILLWESQLLVDEESIERWETQPNRTFWEGPSPWTSLPWH